MWRQIAAGLLGMALSATPVSGMERLAAPAPQVVEARGIPSHLLSGTEAVRHAMNEVAKELVNRYYEKYGGLFVTRRFVERKVAAEINKKRDALLKLVQEKYMADGRLIQFNPQTAQVSYFESRCLRTVTIGEIAEAIMSFRKECNEKS